MKKKMLVILLAGILPLSVFAAEKKGSRKAAPVAAEENTPSSEIPDSDSCGLGWQVTQKKTLSAVTTRATTNYTVPPTFGMTTGTMGCAQHPLSKRDEVAVKYAYNNFETLSVEMAEGRGEFLKSFAQTLGCSDQAFDSFARMTQSNFRVIMNNGQANSLQMFDNVKAAIKQDSVLAMNCNAV